LGRMSNRERKKNLLTNLFCESGGNGDCQMTDRAIRRESFRVSTGSFGYGALQLAMASLERDSDCNDGSQRWLSAFLNGRGPAWLTSKSNRLFYRPG
jgi:hypothetical protein